MFNYDDFIFTSDNAIPRCFIHKDYGNGYQKLLLGRFKSSGFEILENIDDNNISDDYIINPDECKRVSLSRSKRVVRELCACNDFKYFVTLTINADKCDRYCLDECQDLMRTSFHNYQRRCKRVGLDFKYVIITESHLDGAYHFHGVFTCVLTDDIYINPYGYYSSHFFDDVLGFNSFSIINNLDACSKYITKYITKNCCVNSHNQVYFCSKCLRRPVVYRLPVYEEDLKILKDFWDERISNDFVKARDFNFNDLDLPIKLWLQNKKEIDFDNKEKIKEKLSNFLDFIIK